MRHTKGTKLGKILNACKPNKLDTKAFQEWTKRWKWVLCVYHLFRVEWLQREKATSRFWFGPPENENDRPLLVIVVSHSPPHGLLEDNNFLLTRGVGQ